MNKKCNELSLKYDILSMRSRFLICLPFNAEILSKVLVEHFVALQERLSSNAGHCRPPFDSGRRTSLVLVDDPIPQATSHFDQSDQSLTWQSITVKKRRERIKYR